jgi:leucyl aminopeptidase
MNIALTDEEIGRVDADVLAVGVRADGWRSDPVIAELDRALQGAVSRAIEEERFDGALGNSLSLTPLGRIAARRLLLVGLAPVPPSEVSARFLGVAAGRAAAERGSLAVAAPADSPEVIGALIEGVATGAYRFSKYLSVKPAALGRVQIITREPPAAAQQAASRIAEQVAAQVNLARDLVNEPPNSMTPDALAEACRLECAETGVECRVYDRAEIEQLGMGLLLAVGDGSTNQPRFVHMTYRPAGGSALRVVLVGKGITFDSGGLCLKPHEHLPMMKLDMAGAAITLAVLAGAARMGLPIEVHGIIAAAENMTGPSAFRPGDILRSRAGKTVEVVNTDAEGRLVLADALSYARELDPTHIIDFGTLTGTLVLAMGFNIGGLFSNDPQLAARYLQAAMRTGESHWQFPLSPELQPTLKSSVADLRHAAPVPMGSTVTAALFLKEFVGDASWMHLDIAGPSHLMFPQPHPLHPNGGTGFGVLTALHFLRGLAAEAPVVAEQTPGTK